MYTIGCQVCGETGRGGGWGVEVGWGSGVGFERVVMGVRRGSMIKRELEVRLKVRAIL